MRRSKLEMQIDILKVLTRNGPSKLTHIMYKANVNCPVLKQHLDFLIRQNVVEERPVGKKGSKTRVVYTITERGRTILKYFRELNRTLQLTEGEHVLQALPS